MQTLSKKGIVVENKDGNVKIMVQRDSGCGSCSTCGGCEIKPSYYSTFTNQDLNPGDFVFLDSDAKTVNNLSFFTYLFPVSMMILGAVLANTVFSRTDRKSTRLNSSHVAISYAVFCLKKKHKIPLRL